MLPSLFRSPARRSLYSVEALSIHAPTVMYAAPASRDDSNNAVDP
jgi:hypothetical protein